MKQKLRALQLAYLLNPNCIAARRGLAEVKRLLTMKKRVVTVFLQLDDPYSYLLSYYLNFAIKRYKKVEFRFILCQALRGEFMPEPAMHAEHAMRDCKLLAEEFGIPYLDVGEAPVVEHRRALLDFLAEEQDEEGFEETFTSALSAYWRGDAEGVARMLGRPGAENSETSVVIGKNQLLLRKMGHYNCAMMHYAGEWYWGVDRLHYLLDMFEAQKLNRYKETTPELAAYQQSLQVSLPATRPAAAASLPPLEVFISFRSPYSYLALKQTFELADAFGLRLMVRPVLPMAMRGTNYPQPKLMYIVQDANREAAARGVPFGKISDALGPGVERCMAAFYYALGQKKARDFLWATGQAVFAQGIDVSTDEGLQVVADKSGLFWPELREALGDDSWRAHEKKNRDDLYEYGLWGVPSFRIGDIHLWGQDRHWLLARKIEDLCTGGEGILE